MPTVTRATRIGSGVRRGLGALGIAVTVYDGRLRAYAKAVRNCDGLEHKQLRVITLRLYVNGSAMMVHRNTIWEELAATRFDPINT